MRLVTYRAGDGSARLGAIAGDRVVDLAEASGGQLPSEMVAFIERGEAGLDLARRTLAGATSGQPLASTTLLAPIPHPRRNAFCLGLNYHDHAAEAASQGLKLPEYPMYFTKSGNTIVGPGAAIEIDPTLTTQVDWEIELTAVIGTGGRDISKADALSHVFGYTVANDVSARDLQFRHGGQFFKGKSLDTFCPLGPCIVTADEIQHPESLEIWLRVNGVEKQHSNTKHLIFDLETIVVSLSEGLTLEPGDLILTGTPAGVGFARKPPEFLQDGDVVECEIEQIGILSNPVKTRSRA
ncbi:MAG: fumarylacetoacetate hydrolase family protein [Chloroflexota bacterium]